MFLHNSTNKKFPLPEEWPTWLLIIAVYGSWWLCLDYFNVITPIVAIPGLIIVIAWHISLQHELIHEHPTRWPWINSLLGYPPLALIYPFSFYRQSHLQHHNNKHLTVPQSDPESFYLRQRQWRDASGLRRAYLRFRMTLLGRLLLQPAHAAVCLIKKVAADCYSQTWQNVATFCLHCVLVVLLLVLVVKYFEVSAWQYALGAYLGNALSMLRSFYEHRAVTPTAHRSVIVETNGFFSLLFLNNNLHALHHAKPNMAWYRLPTYYRQNKAAILETNHYFYYSGYSAWLYKHLLKPVDDPVHPFVE